MRRKLCAGVVVLLLTSGLALRGMDWAVYALDSPTLEGIGEPGGPPGDEELWVAGAVGFFVGQQLWDAFHDFMIGPHAGIMEGVGPVYQGVDEVIFD